MPARRARPRAPISACWGCCSQPPALAWLLTRERMLAMDAGPGTDPGTLGFFVVSWIVMMAAMMFPSIAPMVLTFAFIQRRRLERGALHGIVPRWTCIAGYLVTWTAFGLLAYELFVGVSSLYYA